MVVFTSLSVFATESHDHDGIYLGHDHSLCSGECTITITEPYSPYALVCSCGGNVGISTEYVIGQKEGNCFQSPSQGNLYSHYRLSIYKRYRCNTCGSDLGRVLQTNSATYCGQYFRQVADHGYLC